MQVPANFVGEGTSLLDASKGQQLEGIVAKRLDFRYTPSGRGGDWRWAGSRRSWTRRRYGVIQFSHKVPAQSRAGTFRD